MILFDTDAAIELTAGGTKAGEFLKSLDSPTLPIPGVVAMELLIGSRDRRELDRHTCP